MPRLAPRPDAPITDLKGVGPKLADTLSRLGIFRLLDLFLHLPMRYQDRTRLTPLRDVRAGETFLIEGLITGCSTTFGRRRGLKVTVSDGDRSVYLRFFSFSRYQQERLTEGSTIRAFGEFRFFGRELSVAHPEYEVFDGAPPEPTPELTPIYPATQGLGQARIRRLMDQLLALPWPTGDDSGVPYDRLRFLHRPPPAASEEDIASAQKTLALDELTAFYLVMKGRALKREATRAVALPRAEGLGRTLLKQLGFQLTGAQAKVVAEVLTDLERSVPMLRLVQGDVGSGKTVIAAFAAIRAAEHGCQTAVMAPTELLAEQHYYNFSAWLEPLGIHTALLTGSMKAADARAVLEATKRGDVQVLVGTHALFQARVAFHRLALSIIDEQHRFGVHQRMSLSLKGEEANTQPHQLIMTATPIPRTLTMALYADMAVSVIDELPKGRQPITTYTAEEGRREEVVQAIDGALERGAQAYWVCTLIEPSDEIDAMSALTLLEALKAALPHRRIGLLHGRMKSADKVATMGAFAAADLDLLVATTVVEVGVDVPNATHMVIENAERLGLAQLHQLRGRVGRGSQPSFCFLLFSQGLSEAAKTRLHAMRDSQDGFYLAEQDLKLRGPGDLLGTRQSGEQSFRIADLAEHAELITEAMQRGERLLRAEPASADYETMFNILTLWAPADHGVLTA